MARDCSASCTCSSCSVRPPDSLHEAVTTRAVIRFGGFCLAGGAVVFLAVFTYLAARFNYPDVLDGPAAAVLPNLLATGPQGRVVWAIYAFLR